MFSFLAALTTMQIGILAGVLAVALVAAALFGVFFKKYGKPRRMAGNQTTIIFQFPDGYLDKINPNFNPETDKKPEAVDETDTEEKDDDEIVVIDGTPVEIEDVQDIVVTKDLGAKGEIVSHGKTLVVNYNRSFTAKYIQSADVIQKRYTTIKNFLLSFEGVTSRVCWGYDAFYVNHKTIARLTVTRKTLSLYLAVSPEEATAAKVKFIDASAIKRYENVPVRMKLKSERSVQQSLRMIAELAKRDNLATSVKQTTSYLVPFETTESLVKQKLIKIYARVLNDGDKVNAFGGKTYNVTQEEVGKDDN